MSRIKEHEAQNNLTNTQIDIFEFVFTILRGWKIILATIAVTFMIGIAFIVMRLPLYEASVKLIISGNDVYSGRLLDESSLSLNQRLVTTYASVAKSRTVMRDVIGKLDLKTDPKTLARNINVQTVEDTEFINIYYKDTDPKRAALVANEISKSFMIYIKELMKFDNLKIAESAEVPKYPDGLGNFSIAIFSVILGACIGGAIVFVLESFHNKLKKPEDVEKIMECPVIGTIPDEGAVEGGKYYRKRKR